jgi:hypothetical protein
LRKDYKVEEVLTLEKFQVGAFPVAYEYMAAATIGLCGYINSECGSHTIILDRDRLLMYT